MRRVPKDGSAKVGYASPPNETQWKKGQSGNPSGRPRAPASLQRMSQAILQTPLKSKTGRKLALTRQDQSMLRIAQEAVNSLKQARLIFKIAYPQTKAAIPHIPSKVLADLRELRAIKESDLLGSPGDDLPELQRKYSLALKHGHLEGRIEQAIEHIELPMDELDD